MAISRGKQLEAELEGQFEKVSDCSVDRIHDQTTGYAGSSNICDFIVYRYPHQYYFECKAIHRAALNFKSHITKTQWDGLLEKSTIKGVKAGIICWWIDHDITLFIPIQALEWMRTLGDKSFNINSYHTSENLRKSISIIPGRKKRIFFEYDLESFLRAVATQ